MMGKRGFWQIAKHNAKEVLGQMFGSAAAPIVSPAAPVVEDIPVSQPPVRHPEDALHGMHNLQNLKTVIKSLTSLESDNGKQVFQLDGSDHNTLFQDIVLVAPDTSKFVLRLDAFPQIDDHKKETDLVVSVELRFGKDEKFTFYPVSNPAAEQEIIHRLMVWMMDKCPQKNLTELDRRIVDHIHLIDGVAIDKWLVRHVPNTFNEFTRPTKEPAPS